MFVMNWLFWTIATFLPLSSCKKRTEIPSIVQYMTNDVGTNVGFPMVKYTPIHLNQTTCNKIDEKFNHKFQILTRNFHELKSGLTYLKSTVDRIEISYTTECCKKRSKAIHNMISIYKLNRWLNFLLFKSVLVIRRSLLDIVWNSLNKKRNFKSQKNFVWLGEDS